MKIKGNIIAARREFVKEHFGAAGFDGGLDVHDRSFHRILFTNFVEALTVYADSLTMGT